MPPKPKITPVQPDPFIGDSKIMGLIDCNFFDFLSDKHAALVMFYNPDCADCKRSRAQIMRAAKITKREDHAFAAVDCTEQAELCKREGIIRFPTFQLYTRGLYVSHRPFPLDYIRMREMIDRTETPPPPHKLRTPHDPPCPKKKSDAPAYRK